MNSLSVKQSSVMRLSVITAFLIVVDHIQLRIYCSRMVVQNGSLIEDRFTSLQMVAEYDIYEQRMKAMVTGSEVSTDYPIFHISVNYVCVEEFVQKTVHLSLSATI